MLRPLGLTAILLSLALPLMAQADTTTPNPEKLPLLYHGQTGESRFGQILDSENPSEAKVTFVDDMMFVEIPVAKTTYKFLGRARATKSNMPCTDLISAAYSAAGIRLVMTFWRNHSEDPACEKRGNALTMTSYDVDENGTPLSYKFSTIMFSSEKPPKHFWEFWK